MIGSLTISDRVKLGKLYRKGSAAYGSVKNLVQASGLSKSKVKTFLQSRDSYTKNKQAIRKHQRLSVHSRYINEIWCLDLAQVDKLSEYNGGTKYLMLIVDVFSRFIRVGKMRNKSAEATKACFINLCSQKDQELTFPKNLWIDKGKEFMADFRNFCDDVGINVYSIHSEQKALFAERYIQSFKNIIYRYLEERKTKKYVDKLELFLHTMNNRINTSTGLRPVDVKNHDYVYVQHNSTHRQRIPQWKKPKFKKGDNVRLAYESSPFRKGYKAQFTDQIYEIYSIATKKPIVTYKVKDLNSNKVLKGRYYEQELQKVII